MRTPFGAARLILGILAAAAAPAQAHPVSFKGAVGLMTWNQEFLSDHWVTYSFRPDMAVAARAMRMTMDGGRDFALAMPQLDFLVKRWNGRDHQANIYAYGGYGAAWFEGRRGAAGMGGIEADAESRSLFALVKYEGMRPTIGENFHHLEARVGAAPYEAEIDEIAAWLMLQWQYHPALERDHSVTPLARFFYKSVLWETGVSTEGDWMLNFMFHF